MVYGARAYGGVPGSGPGGRVGTRMLLKAGEQEQAGGRPVGGHPGFPGADW